MAELAVIGSTEFIMGFQLIGIKKVFEADDKSSLEKIFTKIMIDESIGIMVVEENSLAKLDDNFRKRVENNVSPVCVVLSDKQGSQSNLRETIKKAIGVDLW